MADKIDEEHFDSLTNSQSDNTSAEIIANSGTKAINLNQETENMEVHHHAHHGHEKKTWKIFFWEFFMLFLAVFCGFLAEYQLEHKIENDREAIYIKNLLEDLNDDLNSYANYNTKVAINKRAIDSLFILFKSPSRNIHLADIYFFARKITIQASTLIPNERTYEQMKNSGHLRLIQKRNTATAVSKYYLDIQGILQQNIVIVDKLTLYQVEMGNLFDAEMLWQIFNERQLPNNNNLRLLSEDPITINRYLTAAQYFIATQFRQNDRINEAAKKSRELIELIKKEYKLN
jgi:hypothetical protein